MRVWEQTLVQQWVQELVQWVLRWERPLAHQWVKWVQRWERPSWVHPLEQKWVKWVQRWVPTLSVTQRNKREQAMQTIGASHKSLITNRQWDRCQKMPRSDTQLGAGGNLGMQ
jgi:hypothetical protein